MNIVYTPKLLSSKINLFEIHVSKNTKPLSLPPKKNSRHATGLLCLHSYKSQGYRTELYYIRLYDVKLFHDAVG